jgi:hypothetical protein
MLILYFTVPVHFIFEYTKIMTSKAWLGPLLPSAQQIFQELTCHCIYYSVRSPFANKVPPERITIGAFAASGDKTVRVWDAKSNKPVTTVTTKVRPSLKYQHKYGFFVSVMLCFHLVGSSFPGFICFCLHGILDTVIT